MSGTLAGAVLVGGRSARMGRDKARLRVGNTPLWRRQLRVLEASGARPALLVLRPRQHSFGWRGGEVRDAAPDAGPLGGLVAALLATPSPWIAVVAVDLPRIDASWFRRLRRACRPGVGAVIQSGKGYEPLAAIYPAEAAALCLARLRQRRLSLQPLVADLVSRGLMVALSARRLDRAALANWNTPEDLRGASGRARAL